MAFPDRSPATDPMPPGPGAEGTQATHNAGCGARGRLPGRALRGLHGAPALLAALLLGGAVALPPVRAGGPEDLMRLLQRRDCPGCRLQDADLVRADLRDADLSNARLQRANLSQARLDGAVLTGADLRFASLQGASLRGADLRGARLEGLDLRQADLSAAQLDEGALSRSHWEGAIGLQADQFTYAQLHNAGVQAAAEGRFPAAETFFSQAIQRQPDAPVSWVARGISRQEQGNSSLAAQDLNHAAALVERSGDPRGAQELRAAAAAIGKPGARPRGGNGLGGQVLGGIASFASALAPLAMKFLVPLAF